MRRFWLQLMLAFALLVPMLSIADSDPSIANAQNCELTQGFQTIHDMIPEIVGNCVENVYYVQQGPAAKDGLQRTTNGLLVWRWYDNVVAFTNGYQTWILMPNGQLQTRLNSELLAWEEEIQNAVHQVNALGYEVSRTSTYNPEAQFHVLIGFQAPTADANRQNAFFFTTRATYLGTDTSTSDPSANIGVASQSDNEVTLSYELYMPNDPMCCSTGGTGNVRFFFDGNKVTPLDPIPTSDFNAPKSRR